MRKHLQHLPRSKHRDDIVVANIKVDKVGMVADMEVDIEINMEIQFGKRVGYLIGPRLVQPKAYLTCASSIICIHATLPKGWPSPPTMTPPGHQQGFPSHNPQLYEAPLLPSKQSVVHTWYLSFLLHSHILSHENFTLEKCVNSRQIWPTTKRIGVLLHNVECKTTRKMYHCMYMYLPIRCKIAHIV